MGWTTSIAALLTPLIGIATVIIAYQKWRTNKRIQETNERRLKHERYEKRFAVYDSARTFLRKIMLCEKNVSDAMIDAMVIDYWSGINPARFLLDEEITAYLAEIEHIIIKWRETKTVPSSKGI